MKVNLVVATGVHSGKVIPILVPQFLVGRDPQCQLRPASQAVSKQHCAILIRDGKVYLKDFGSTNGTLVNDALVQNEERLLSHDDSLKIGPLDFLISIEAGEPKVDGTPLPNLDPKAAEALAAVKAATQGAPRAPVKNPTPVPGSKPAAAPKKDGSKEGPALKPDSKESPALGSSKTTGAGADDEAESDRLAALLLGLDDGEVPGGSTVVDVPLPADVAATGEAPKEGEKPPEKKAVASREDTSNAASDILRRYMRRPR